MAKGGSGCALVVIVVLIIALAVWALAIGLWVLGAGIAIGSVIGAMGLLYSGWHGVAIAREVKRVDEEIALIAQDCVDDLQSLEFRWADVMVKKGIGTGVEHVLRDNPAFGEQRQRQIAAMRRMVERAPGSQQRLAAISQAEALRVELENELAL